MEMVASAYASYSPEIMATTGSKGRTAFQWGGTIFTMNQFTQVYIFIITTYIFNLRKIRIWLHIVTVTLMSLFLLYRFHYTLCYWIFRIRLLLILNRRGQRPSLQALLLVIALFTTFPTVLFNILRGQFGCWVALLTVSANLYFPEVFPASRFLLFVVTPNWVANGLRDSIVGGVFCLIIGSLLVIMELGRIEGCDHFCFWYFIGIFSLLFFTILYLYLGPW